jgi:hypothetical protein
MRESANLPNDPEIMTSTTLTPPKPARLTTSNYHQHAVDIAEEGKIASSLQYVAMLRLRSSLTAGAVETRPAIPTDIHI